MGCRLPKLRKAEERRSPGNIYSTLRRPQVETKVGVAYTYHFLDFLLGKEGLADIINVFLSFSSLLKPSERWTSCDLTWTHPHTHTLNTVRCDYLFLPMTLLYLRWLTQKTWCSSDTSAFCQLKFQHCYLMKNIVLIYVKSLQLL